MQGEPIPLRSYFSKKNYVHRSEQDQKMSGRSLRRLPVLAHARYISLGYVSVLAPVDFAPQKAINGTKASSAPGPNGLSTQVEVWLNAMEKVVEGQAGELKRFEQ
jgi:pachytene checkpoint protein 2